MCAQWSLSFFWCCSASCASTCGQITISPNGWLWVISAIAAGTVSGNDSTLVAWFLSRYWWFSWQETSGETMLTETSDGFCCSLSRTKLTHVRILSACISAGSAQSAWMWIRCDDGLFFFILMVGINNMLYDRMTHNIAGCKKIDADVWQITQYFDGVF